jgi:hypothetical protein
MSGNKEFEGKGKTIEEALNNARRAARLALGGRDRNLDYEVKRITGHYFGFAGDDEVTVTIRLL